MTGGEKVRSVVSEDAHGILEQKISAGRCMVLDGGVATELPADRAAGERLWGEGALLSDAYRLSFADEDVMVVYLLEITHDPRRCGEEPLHGHARDAYPKEAQRPQGSAR